MTATFVEVLRYGRMAVEALGWWALPFIIAGLAVALFVVFYVARLGNDSAVRTVELYFEDGSRAILRRAGRMWRWSCDVARRSFVALIDAAADAAVVEHREVHEPPTVAAADVAHAIRERVLARREQLERVRSLRHQVTVPAAPVESRPSSDVRDSGQARRVRLRAVSPATLRKLDEQLSHQTAALCRVDPTGQVRQAIRHCEELQNSEVHRAMARFSEAADRELQRAAGPVADRMEQVMRPVTEQAEQIARQIGEAAAAQLTEGLRRPQLP